MQVAKPFLRGNTMMQPGDTLPKDVDAETIAHYRRHGMVVDADDAKKRASAKRTVTPNQNKTPGPSETKTPGPSETKEQDAATDPADPSGAQAPGPDALPAE